MPSGQEAADALVAQGRIKSDERLSRSQLSSNTCDRSGSILRKNGLEQNTPLFYYILKEAELKAEGLTLGPVGSHIVSEVVQSALEGRFPMVTWLCGSKWELPEWRFPERLPAADQFSDRNCSTGGRR